MRIGLTFGEYVDLKVRPHCKRRLNCAALGG